MQKKNKVLASKEIYKNSWIKIREDKVLQSDGSKGTYGIIEYGDGASVVALTDKVEIYLVKEYKFGAGEDILELPSGGINKKETPLAGAKRELKEEVGLQASNWHYLGYIRPLTTIIDHKNHMFLATNLKQFEASLEEGEVLKIIKIPFRKAFSLAMNNKIVHGASCVGILKTYKYLKDKGDIDF